MTIAIALFLVLTIAASMVILPLANAHDPAWTIPTYAFVSAAPNLVGVGETTVIVVWLQVNPPTAGGVGGDLWRDFTVTITKPDGAVEKIVIPESGQTGSAWLLETFRAHRDRDPATLWQDAVSVMLINRPISLPDVALFVV